MAKHKKRHSHARSIWLILLLLVGLGVLIAALLKGHDIRLFDPKGTIAQSEYKLILFTIGLGLVVIIPTMIALYFIAWKYRETNSKSTYDAHAHHGKLFVFSIWAIPSLFMLIMALVMWPAAHKLAPKVPLSSDNKPLTVQVVALRWKWLFIYPEQNIASVNFVDVPVNTPVQFIITADETPMSSFWIPHLSGQLYAMTGHVNQLNLMASELGDYPGSSAEINGAGFADMKFTVRVSAKQDFDQWVQKVKQSPDVLDAAEYRKLLTPTEANASVFYATAENDLYQNTLKKYAGSHNHGGSE